MLILHACWNQGKLLLWAETAVQAGARTAPRKSAKPLKGPVGHPFAAPVAELRRALDAAGLSPEPAAGRRTAVAWLPTLSGWPLASNPLLEAKPAGRRRPRLEAWKVPVLSLDLEQAVETLGTLGGRPVAARGILTGPDLRFWSGLLRFGGSLVAREQILPALARRKKNSQAVWEPVFAGRDLQHFHALVREMPPAARALTATATDAPPEPAPAALAREFLDDVADHLARTALAGGAAKTASASAHEAWLAALATPTGRVAGSAGELAELALTIEDWKRPLAALATAPFRLCLRLEEPAPSASSHWQLRYLLQAADDPSLLVPAEKVWKTRGKVATLLRRDGHEPRETLLASLGQAAGLSEPIRRSLDQAAPAGCELPTAEAHDFLRHAAPVLEQAGFGILLPSWWTGRGPQTRLALRAQVKSPKGSTGAAAGLTLDSLLHVHWEAALDGQRMSLRELQALARLKEPLVQMRGRWVEIDPASLKAALTLWDQGKVSQATLGQVIQLAVGAGETPGDLPVENMRAAGKVGQLLAALQGDAAFEELPAPDGLKALLRPYQLRGYSWLAFLGRFGLGACLADDMGLGKTVQTLALLQRHSEAGEGGPVLLVCPTSVLNNWQREAERFTPELPLLVHHGPGRPKGAAFRRAAARHALVVTSYSLLQRDADTLEKMTWRGVVLDEAQNVKSPDAKQARAARSLRAAFRIALTGTPVENHVGELWSIMEFLNPGLLGNRAAFRRRFQLPIQSGNAPEAAAELKRRVQPFLLRRVKTDPAILPELPAKQERKVYCGLTREQAGLYAAVLREGEKQIRGAEGIQRRGSILALLTRLKQVCNHPAHYLGDGSRLDERSGKLERLLEMLEEILESGERVLLFSQYRVMGEMLQTALTESFGHEVLFLHGGVPKVRRDEMVKRFQGKDGPPMFVLSLKAGGTGLNLTAANHVFHFDRWWNPAVEDQATDRVHRIGQKRRVQVHKLLCAGTLEERIDTLMDRKREVAGAVVGAGEGWLSKLSNQDLRKILALDRTAVME
ncbi:MAG: DEAD/DEAH box helicase [Planctomycetes bacterium]|nr:DEAD/DEAH box helicase [Planctomycetota bacterium]MBL7007622.1 DEAD/DEAH box helicase [Planctomycetota bacterium]